ncbi:MAG: T9SS type A sorting domain-containing protein [Ignavibacteriaceae bacterium]|nr:T9SS type A sorting domain-containing protein [Ignavibacteriaceae bacterium]
MFRAFSFLLLTFFFGTLFAQTPETEPNSTCGDPGIITISSNTSFSGSVSGDFGSDRYDYYYIALGTTGTITVSISNLFFEVFAYDDAYCGSAGYLREGDGSPSTPFVKTLNGSRYYQLIVSNFGPVTASYTITVSGATFPSTATDVYLTENSADFNANIAYPKVGFGSPITTPFSWTPTSPDWTYNAPKCTLYVVPSGDEGLVATSFVVNFDATKASLSASAGSNNIFSSGIFQTQATAAGRLKINAANISSSINVTPGSDKYLAMLVFTMLKPGHMEVTIDSLDFRQYDTENNEQVDIATEAHEADVKFYLGDFANSSVQTTGDGLININDLSPFATAYWSNYAQSSTLYKSKFDIGPTSASGNYFALPTPDGNINFEDLIIFAIGYGKSAGSQLPKLNPAPLNIAFGEQIAGDLVRVPVLLSGNVADVRGLSFSLNTSMKLVAVEKAGALGTENGFVIFRQDGNSVMIDAAVIGGESISNEGVIAYLVFENKADLAVDNIIARNSWNQNLNTALVSNSLGSAVPVSFSLSQNYPNPFNPSTVISFGLPVASKVTLKIYNSLGQEVATLVNGEMLEAGAYSKSFDASKLTSGVYMYKITTDNFSAVKKMLLTK